jgi:hypothetical protein
MKGPRECQGFIVGSGLKSVEPRKSPGCLRVPGLFFLLSEVRAGAGICHGCTNDASHARAAS